MPEPHETRSIIENAEQAAAAGNYASAEDLLRQAAALQEQTLGPHHPDLANTFNNLGIVCEITDNPIDAEHYFRRAHAIATATLAPDHPFVATSRKNLHDFCAARGRPVELPPSAPAVAAWLEAPAPRAAPRHESSPSAKQQDVTPLPRKSFLRPLALVTLSGVALLLVILTTGHADGLITINVEEADDVTRETIKQDLHEPYRTLLGHFRHEVGHYYWDRLVRDSKWLGPFRELFGDERADYAQSLRRNYEQGPPPGWADSFISSYASTHPWEDWAETWAHYLHMVDSLGTAFGFGLDAEDLEGRIKPFTAEDLYAADDPEAARFLSLLTSWFEMIMVLNELARSMGEPDFYPFVMSKRVVAKLQLIYMIVADARPQAPASAAA